MSESDIAELSRAVGRIEESIHGLKNQLSERCSGYQTRIQALEKQMEDLKADHHKRKGGIAALSLLMAAAAALGGIGTKYLSFLSGGK